MAAPTAETYEILADAWQRLGLRDEVMAETGTHGGYAPRRGAKYKERDRGSKVRYPPFTPPHPPDRKGAWHEARGDVTLNPSATDGCHRLQWR